MNAQMSGDLPYRNFLRKERPLNTLFKQAKAHEVGVDKQTILSRMDKENQTRNKT